MAIELCVQDRVDVGGAVSDIARAYSEFDAFLLPSVFEGFPVVLSEVALAGVPVITTPNGDLPTVFGGGRGVIVQPNAFSIAAGIMRLVDSPLRRWEMAEAAQAYAHKFLTDQYMGRCYAALINEVTS
jgi:glycosyltransferase involved in cell wall biosynthesis